MPKKKINLGSILPDKEPNAPQDISVLFFYCFFVVFYAISVAQYINGQLDPLFLKVPYLKAAAYSNFETVIVKQVSLFDYKLTLTRTDIYCFAFFVLAVNFLEFVRFSSIYILKSERIRKFCLALVNHTALTAIVCGFVAFSTLYSSYASIRNASITEATKLESELNSGENFVFNKNLNSTELDRLSRFSSVEKSLLNASADTSFALSIPNNSRAISLAANDFSLKKIVAVVFSVNDFEVSHKTGISFIEAKPVNSFLVLVPHDKIEKFKNLSIYNKSTLLLRAENPDLFCKEFSGFKCQLLAFKPKTVVFSWKSSSLDSIPYNPESLLDELRSKDLNSSSASPVSSVLKSAMTSQAQFKDLMIFVGIASTSIIIGLVRLLAYVTPSYLRFLHFRSVSASPKSFYLFIKRRHFLVKLAAKNKTIFYVKKVDLDFVLAALTVIICFSFTILTIAFFKL